MNKIFVVLLASAAVAVNSVVAFGAYGYDPAASMAAGVAGVAGAAATSDSLRAAGHNLAAENRATDAMIDHATGNQAGAINNEMKSMAHSAVAGQAASRSNAEAAISGAAANVATGLPLAGAALARSGGIGIMPGLNYPSGFQYPAWTPYGAMPFNAYGAGYGYPAAGLANPMAVPFAAGTNRGLLYNAIGGGPSLANGLASAAMAGQAATAAATAANMGVVPRMGVPSV